MFSCLLLKWQPQTFGEGIITVFVCSQGVEVTRMPRSHFSPLSTLWSSLPKKWFPVCIHNTMWTGTSHGLHDHPWSPWNQSPMYTALLEIFFSSNRAGIAGRGTQKTPVPRAYLQHSMGGPRSSPVPSTLGKITSGRNDILPFRDARIFPRRALGCLLQGQKILTATQKSG